MPRHIVRMHFMTTLVVFLVVRFCSGIFCSSQNRKINSNGTACTELEHCVSSFNPQTGECLGPGNQCDPGWMGPGCQYVNLAFHPGMNSDPVFDGDMTTHRTIEDGRATIRFNGIFNINALRIRTIPSNGQQGTLSVRDNQNRILYNDSFPSSSPTVFFTNSSLTNGLHMEFSPSLDIAEIEVFGGKNVALWKSTHQSTTYSYDGISFTPDKAVDGNGNGDWDIHTCTHTQPSGDHPTWSVDLGNVYYIIAIKIKNRNDNQDRLNGFKIYGTPEKGDLLLIYNDSSQTHNRSEIFLDSSHMVDVPIKMISIKGSNTGEKILTLCEVYIYASIKRKNGSFCPEKCQKNSNCRTDNLVCRTCQDGWEGPYCYPIVCQQPISWNAPHISTSQKTYRYNETIRFLCSGGYYLSENQERKCTKNGPLEPPFPNCIAITCQQPVSWNTPNISTNQNTYKYNETIRFLCSEGFYLQGNQERKCTKNGLLEPPFPNCTAITCQQPVSWKSTNISTNRKTYRYNETIRFLCSEGFYLQGNQERKCTKSGPLEPPFPNCTAITCQPPVSSEAPHIMTDKETYNYNEIIQFSCSEGFFLQANQERNCTKNGPLKPPYPNCKEVRCSTPEFEQKEIIILTNVTDHKYNKTIQFECKQGFSLKGSQKATCHQNASFWFIDGTPKCEGVICRTPAFEQKEIIILTNVTDHKYNKTIQFECKQGFSLKGSQKATCHQNASFWFIDGTPKCEEVRCRTPTLQQKDVMIKPNKTSHKYNTTVQFECKQGFSLKGPQQATCQQNASFLFIGGTQPECEVSEEDNSLSEAVVAGVSVGSLAAIAAVVVVVIIVLRKRRSKKPDSKYYKNDALSLDDIDHQYAEVNANRTKKNKGASKQEEASNEQKTTYYNMNSHDVDKAKQARQEVYYEFSPVCRPSETAIPVTEFKNYVEIKKGNQEFFAEQFKKFYTGLQFPATAAVAPGNKSKNKYKNIYPYDETRVLLKVEKGSSDSDFINASFIHGFGNVKSYIAAQGPLINTIDDFWWMVWNEKSDKIVMLTNLSEDDKVKCIKYWPDSDSMDTRNMKLELVVSESFADFTIRTFNLINGKESRTIRQFHFTAWPDKGVPAYASSLVHFHSKVIHTPGTLKGPMVVHCSAGIGRTGTFIALNYLVQQAKESGYVDVFECVETLRRQRLNMVQTLEQYKFLHNATLEALMCTSSDPSASKFPQIYEDLFKVDAETGKRNIDLNFENLNVALSTLPESAYSLAKNSTNRKKNRYSNILPVDFEMPEIRDEENNPIYINAVFLPAYKSKRSFIATQMPLKDTVVDFWRLLYEQQVSTIVMLNQLGSDKPKENIGKYWPKDLNAVFEFGPFRITKKGLTEGKDFTIVDLCCHKEGQNEDERKLRLFQCHFWPDSSTVPTSVLAFLKLINDVELHHDRNNSGPLVVHCMNGAEKSGLFCVMQVVLERMKIEQDVAIHHVIQQMRSIRPSIIPNVEQFKFCHDVVLEFLKQFDDYSNFQ
nr:uncharacterized protein LOC105322541 isoform X3 [Crassostrea gigas]